MVVLWLASFALLVPGLSLAQKADVKAEALRDLTEMQSTMVKIANAMPEDTFGYRPTPPQRSFAEHILHVADANVVWTETLGGQATPPTVNEVTSKEEMVPLRDRCNFGRSSWLISQVLSVTYVPREHRLYLERSCRPLKIRPQQTAAWRGACLFQRG